ncbi:MAG: valine--tRNA ligase [Spirochaetota bacterium]
MTDRPLAKVFNPKDFEKRIYSLWLKKNSFAPVDKEGTPFVIVIPPPNVTGVLHMGHGLNNVLQDILIRYYRMAGRTTLWVPGTDHAGIATQNVVEKKLRAQGTSRSEVGRKKFLEETWKVKEEHHRIILKQLTEIGASCDWSRERFTMDEGLSRAVREVFVGLFEKDLIYKGNYLVNWCSECGTALSDDEVEHKEVIGKMYHYYYPLVDENGRIEIATSRPETMLGDTAVAVHPEDERYKNLAGKMVRLPLTERQIPIITDAYVDMSFGTGAVKVTPAHDPNDWEIGNRHNLVKINILNPDGTLNGSVPLKYQGLKILKARKMIVEDLKKGGVFIKEVDYSHQVGHCYRCGTLIEPYLSDQWFVRMKPLAEKALKAWQEGRVKFYPKKWENTYIRWLEVIRDWCISRQLWWGHRIPVWYCADCGEMMVLRTDPASCRKCGSINIQQDEDVLDTWFSSWLWPFSTLGWPEKTEDLKKFFPTTSLVTAYDILFFWVARMIMASMEFMGMVPFQDVYIHGLIRDKQGRKMSKSLGNGIDPLEIVDEYGADSLKFTLTFLAAQGQDILIDREDFKFGSRFANKIWNASRFILMNLYGRKLSPIDGLELDDIDRWIFHRLNKAVDNVRRAVERYRFNDAASVVYEFFWNDFCDWYIEASKLNLYSKDDKLKDRAASLLVHILEESLRLLHPFLSFITEEIYQKLREYSSLGLKHSECIITAPYPEAKGTRENPGIETHFSSLQELVTSVRTLRSEFTIPPSSRIRLHVITGKDFHSAAFLNTHKDLITLLVHASEVTISDKRPEVEGSVPLAGFGFEAYVFVKDVIDVPKEVAKLKNEISKTEKQLERVEGRLADSNFLENAPPEIVLKEKGIREELWEKLKKMRRYVKDLEES